MGKNERDRRRREARERLERLYEMEPPPVMYVAAEEFRCRKAFPPDVLAGTKKVACWCCSLGLLTKADTLEKFEAAVKRAGRELVPLCSDCGRRFEDDPTTTTMQVVSPAFDARMRQWQTEAN